METHKCEKCGYSTTKYKALYKHYRRKFSCNKDYDKQILLLAYDKIKTFETSQIDYDAIYEENGYVLSIKRSCFYNTPYFEDFQIRYRKLDGKLITAFFAEWNEKGKLKFAETMGYSVSLL